MVFNATFNNISAISCRSVLLVEETGENNQIYHIMLYRVQGRIQDFKLGGAHLKKLRRMVGGVNIFGVFRVKNYDFTPKNHIFSNFKGGAPVRPLPWIRPWCTPHHGWDSNSQR
jgi:hypothetical protein